MPTDFDRRGFLFMGGGALLATPLLVAACDSQKVDSEGGNTPAETPPAHMIIDPSKPTPEMIAADVALLNKGILLEQQAILAYTAAAGLPFIKSDATVLGVAGAFMGHHKEHRDVLIAAIKKFGGTPVDYGTAKTPDIPKEILDEALEEAARKTATLQFARGLERGAAEAYHGLIASQLQTEAARRGALEIFPTEAMHVAVYDLVLGAKGGPVNAAMFSNQR